jgi:hypothetical protein
MRGQALYQEATMGMWHRSWQNAWGSILIVVADMVLTPVRGDDAPKSAAQNERLRALQEIVEGTEMAAISHQGRIKIEPILVPIFVYDDPARLYTDGAIWAWGRAGRPAALMTLTTMKRASGGYSRNGEMLSLAAVPLSASIPPDWVWEPDRPGLLRQPLPNSPAPAEDEARRLRQMKEQARRFRGLEYFAPTREAAVERYELRLLVQPVLRYTDPNTGLLDGSIFLMAYGTNPEIALLIEVSKDGTSPPTWYYAVARMGRAELRVSLDQSEVWRQPNIPPPSIHDPYAGFTRRIADPSAPP